MNAIHEEGQYPGIRVGMESQMDQMKIPMKLDITTGDVITPKEINYSFPLIFENRSIPILAYNLETLLAEKFKTVIDRAKENTRMRDFYDLFYCGSFIRMKLIQRFYLMRFSALQSHEEP